MDHRVIDGTKVPAKASKHSAVSHGHAEKTRRTLKLEIAELPAKADEADATPRRDGRTIPAEGQRRQARKPLRAKAEREACAYARFQAGPAGHEAKLCRFAPQAPGPAPQSKDQVNFADPESPIMKTKDGFPHAYNTQTGAETASRLIVGPRVGQAAHDKREVLPDVAAVCCHVLPDTRSVGRGFAGEAAVTAMELATPGLTVLAARQREPHGRTVAQLDKRVAPPAASPAAPCAERLRHRTASTAGRAPDKLRQQTVEPGFGLIREVLGFRRFSRRGLA